jgi:hypothetical protein
MQIHNCLSPNTSDQVTNIKHMQCDAFIAFLLWQEAGGILEPARQQRNRLCFLIKPTANHFTELLQQYKDLKTVVPVY